MKPSEALRYDHKQLRRKLSLLHDLLPRVQAKRMAAARIVNSLAVQLRSHSETEERLLEKTTLYSRKGTGNRIDSLLRLHDEHENHRTRLAVLHKLLTQENPACDAQQVAAQAGYLQADLEALMREEEDTLFPLIDREINTAQKTHREELMEHLGMA